MSKFFIDRPIFAWVIALVIMLVGALSILKLPINQYPSIAPPAIAISGDLPGRFGANRAGHRGSGDRAAAQRYRQPALCVLGK